MDVSFNRLLDEIHKYGVEHLQALSDTGADPHKFVFHKAKIEAARELSLRLIFLLPEDDKQHAQQALAKKYHAATEAMFFNPDIGRLPREVSNDLRDFAIALQDADFEGGDEDDPEGMRRLWISETLAEQMAERLHAISKLTKR